MIGCNFIEQASPIQLNKKVSYCFYYLLIQRLTCKLEFKIMIFKKLYLQKEFEKVGMDYSFNDYPSTSLSHCFLNPKYFFHLFKKVDKS